MNDKFLKEIANSLFFDKTPAAEEHQCLFRLRFHPENYKLQTNPRQDNNNTIASLMKQELNCLPTDIQGRLAEVIRELVNQYQLELDSDKQESQNWINRKQGQRGIWREVYQWLWDYKFPRWELDHLYWEPLKQQVYDENWIKIKPETVRNWELLELPEPEPLPVGEPLFITIKLPPESRYLLLLHRGITQRCFLCPSMVFAPQYRADENVIRLPQTESYWYQQKKIGIRLTTPGTDEYIAIALKEALDFDWLNPTKQELIPNWTSDRMEQLLGWLSDNPSSWQGCYQEFKVVKR
ncbi:hypothetical protein [Lyngbya sp. PCC 8106]|uniref:hypothetical protein n=1 Tax=Lyngbya sp. (strain PCC 8106) TaxID=313612 RepID=UPI0000EAA1DA|nr:hypothetical protein [Lyngbya sp. PCC 8106]EAW33335.1 hypothetical protein L8106_03177 [Lyngbya sp. PCC 8106]